MTDAPLIQNSSSQILVLEPLHSWRVSIRGRAEILIANSLIGAVVCAMLYIALRAVVLFS